MDEVWKIVLGTIAGVGGIGGVLLAIVKFSSNIIATRLEEKYALKLNKELEKYKSCLENKTYISKTKFDTAFNIYRDLSKAFFEMVKTINIMIPYGLAHYPANKDDKKKYENQCYYNASDAVVLAQDVLNSNAPFISEGLFEEYNEILKLCKMQLNAFSQRWNVLYMTLEEEKGCLAPEDYMHTKELNDKFAVLNTNIRAYISTLDVLE